VQAEISAFRLLMLILCLVYFSTLTKEAICSNETSGYLRTTSGITQKTVIFIEISTRNWNPTCINLCFHWKKCRQIWSCAYTRGYGSVRGEWR
jgi:hypothetical protein